MYVSDNIFSPSGAGQQRGAQNTARRAKRARLSNTGARATNARRGTGRATSPNEQEGNDEDVQIVTPPARGSGAATRRRARGRTGPGRTNSNRGGRSRTAMSQNLTTTMDHEADTTSRHATRSQPNTTSNRSIRALPPNRRQIVHQTRRRHEDFVDPTDEEDFME